MIDRRPLVLLLLIATSGCVPLGTFDCRDDADCDPDGACEPIGYCSFPDEGCPSGSRFSRYAAGGSAGRCVEPGASGWWDPAWSRRRRLVFGNGAQEGSLNGFPVLVALDAERIDYSVAGSDGRDLRFIDDDGETVLAAEVELWDPEGTSIVWVAVPRIEAASDEDFIDLYYGNPDAMELAGGSPWAEGFVGVWHLGQSLLDASGAGNNASATGTSVVPGVIGEARSFAANDSIDAGTSSSMADIFDGGGSISAWVRAEAFGSYTRIVDKASDESSSEGYSLLLADDGESIGTLRFARGFSINHAGWSGPPNSFTLGDWHHVAVTYDATVASNTPVLYMDGDAITVITTPVGSGEPQTDIAQRFTLGNTSVDAGGTSRSLQGALDEVRLTRTLRTSDWIAAEFLNGTDAFVTYGPETQAP